MKTTSVLLLKIERVLENYFGPPFLHDGMVDTKFVDSPKGSFLQVKIGRREVTLDEELNVVASCTDMTQRA